ncbi:MAG: rRNA maturation RNase YbeY [Lachnospiraceae bacterium]|nr:rRNA maturation RNase YbeY [Lachnospiraceae bacterium]
MIFCVRYETDKRLPFVLGRLGKRVFDAVLSFEQFPFRDYSGVLAAEAGLLLTDEAGIVDYNKAYRGINKSTDVLSFPSVTYQKPTAYEALQKQAGDVYDEETGHYYLGDIVLNVDRVNSQALEYGHSVKREAAFLIAHSVLHLIGYDHETKEEAAIMEQKQEQILNLLKITRDHGE